MSLKLVYTNVANATLSVDMIDLCVHIKSHHLNLFTLRVTTASLINAVLFTVVSSLPVPLF